jgi:RNA polymerase sigma factor (sigma-70 family)
MSASHAINTGLSMPAPEARSSSRTEESTQAATSVDWAGLAARVHDGDESGMEQLYRLFNRGIRYFLARRLGTQDLEDRLHDTFLSVVRAIQRGDLREPERLMGFVRTIAQRQVAAYIDRAVRQRHDEADIEVAGVHIADRGENPEQTFCQRERAALMKRVLLSLSARDREVLERFYLKEQSETEIRAAMALTETQFRLLKSRAKRRFGELGKEELGKQASARGKLQLLRSFAAA